MENILHSHGRFHMVNSVTDRGMTTVLLSPKVIGDTRSTAKFRQKKKPAPELAKKTLEAM
ncbi:hypothetical protein DSM2777_04430 [Obesumbacterium proteus]|nr:hypothetical protein DSM2777_04430 [Obesumbacterium proteus]